MKLRDVVALALLTLTFDYAHAQDAAPASEPASSERSTLSERSEDIRDLIRQVAASSGTAFIIDPRVRANVERVPAGGIGYAELLGILRVHGYVAIPTDGRVHVVPNAMARQLATRIVQQDDSSVPDDELVTRIVRLDRETAQMVPILRPMLPQYAHMAAMGNSLVIVDHYDNVRRLTALAMLLSENLPR